MSHRSTFCSVATALCSLKWLMCAVVILINIRSARFPNGRQWLAKAKRLAKEEAPRYGRFKAAAFGSSTRMNDELHSCQGACIDEPPFHAPCRLSRNAESWGSLDTSA